MAVSIELEVEKGHEECSIPDDIPDDAIQAKVPLEAFYKVCTHTNLVSQYFQLLNW